MMFVSSANSGSFVEEIEEVQAGRGEGRGEYKAHSYSHADGLRCRGVFSQPHPLLPVCLDRK